MSAVVRDPGLTLLEATVLRAVAAHYLAEKPRGDVVIEGAIDKITTAAHECGRENPKDLYAVEKQIELMNLGSD